MTAKLAVNRMRRPLGSTRSRNGTPGAKMGGNMAPSTSSSTSAKAVSAFSARPRQ